MTAENVEHVIGLRALTLRAPWGTHIALSGKRIENRTWHPPRSIVGQRIAIHQGGSGRPCEFVPYWADLCRERLRAEEKGLSLEADRAGQAALPLGEPSE